MALAVCVPLLIVAAIFPSEVGGGADSAGHRPLIYSLFMAMVGMGAADANRREFHGLPASDHFS